MVIQIKAKFDVDSDILRLDDYSVRYLHNHVQLSTTNSDNTYDAKKCI